MSSSWPQRSHNGAEPTTPGRYIGSIGIEAASVSSASISFTDSTPPAVSVSRWPGTRRQYTRTRRPLDSASIADVRWPSASASVA